MSEPETPTSLSVEVNPEGIVLILIKAPDLDEPAVFGFDAADARRFARTLRQASEEAEFIERMQRRIVT